MPLMLKKFDKFIENAKNIIVTTHTYPDADGIGSEVALCLALKKLGKKAKCVNEVPLLERYSYLDSENLILGHDEYLEKYGKNKIDLFIVVDTNNPSRIGANMVTLFDKAKNKLFIDHHPCPKPIELIHCIDTSKAATGQIVGEIIEGLGLEFTKSMALPLYTSILIDSSSFRYPTVTGSTHELIGKLLKTGIKPSDAYNSIYGTKQVSHIQMLGAILSKAQVSKSKKVAWITVTNAMIEKYESDVEDTHAFINHLLILEDIKVACMFRDLDGQTKVSFRSAGDVDVGEIAAAFGGGGHNHSAATIINGEYKDVIPETIKKLELMLE
jgi:phosphoesterase RecJ-like protein